MTTAASTPSFRGFKVIIMGPSGTGKTYSTGTLVDSLAGKGDVFYLDIDGSLETLKGYWADKGKPIPAHLHWHVLAPKTSGFDSLISMADATGKFDLSTLAKMKDNNRGANNQFIEVLKVLNNFTDQRTGESFGPVDSWTNLAYPNLRVLIIDSLTALNKIVMDMVVGTRVMRDKPDYGIAQNNVMNLLSKLTQGCTCPFILIAHVERQVDEILGGVKLMPVTIGQATKAELPIPFSDVILSARNGTEFFWDSANGQADLKVRNLPISSKLPANFGPLLGTWEKRRDAE